MVNCERLAGGDTKLWLAAPESARLQFGSVIIPILHFVRPADSYDNTDGMGWGARGGQDLLLVKLGERAASLPACLPGPHYPDTATPGRLAGYGAGQRESCLTDSHGPMKFHMCVTPPCMRLLGGTCTPEFTDGLRNYTGCQTEDLSPAKWSRRCSRELTSNL